MNRLFLAIALVFVSATQVSAVPPGTMYCYDMPVTETGDFDPVGYTLYLESFAQTYHWLGGCLVSDETGDLDLPLVVAAGCPVGYHMAFTCESDIDATVTATPTCPAGYTANPNGVTKEAFMITQHKKYDTDVVTAYYRWLKDNGGAMADGTKVLTDEELRVPKKDFIGATKKRVKDRVKIKRHKTLVVK